METLLNVHNISVVRNQISYYLLALVFRWLRFLLVHKTRAMRSNQSEETCCVLDQIHHRKKTETNNELADAHFPALGTPVASFPPLSTSYIFSCAYISTGSLHTFAESFDWFNASFDSVVIGQRQADVTGNFRGDL